MKQCKIKRKADTILASSTLLEEFKERKHRRTDNAATLTTGYFGSSTSSILPNPKKRNNIEFEGQCSCYEDGNKSSCSRDFKGPKHRRTDNVAALSTGYFPGSSTSSILPNNPKKRKNPECNGYEVGSKSSCSRNVGISVDVALERETAFNDDNYWRNEYLQFDDLPDLE